MTIAMTDLLKAFGPVEITGTPAGDVIGITDDSRDADNGFLFFAIKGVANDGHLFLKNIKKNIAGAVVEHFVDDSQLPQIKVASTRDAFSKALKAYYGLGLETMRFIGVTGTNGKTTYTYLMESIFKAAGEKAGVIGTVNYRCGEVVYEATHTTPDTKRLFPIFKAFANAGCTDIIMETSSHALSQGRLNGILFDAAVFTNLTPEHMDYHKDMEQYYQSKKLLFTNHMKKDGFVLVNTDDQYGERLKQELGDSRVFSYSFTKMADYKCNVVSMGPDGAEVGVTGKEFCDIVKTELKGRFNAYNVISAYITALNIGMTPDIIKAGIFNLKNVPGRFEELKNSLGLKVFIDYAHTPDALDNILKAVKEIAAGRVITVFGCGGDRDKTKRPAMGRIASEYSDITVITSDNPRTEDAVSIIEDIKKGIDFSRKVLIQPDREKAIYDAVYSARKGDTILIAGKGHEEYQIIGGKKNCFSDRSVAGEALKRRECLVSQTS
jgi:UDP-N-acetylmuramoyl-L-alanyl-D-glutamate--2,6-diaminopimelate ligase